METRIQRHVRQILIEKGLPDTYIEDKMERFEGIEDGCTKLAVHIAAEAVALSSARFLDGKGRSELAHMLKVTTRDLEGYWECYCRL